MLTLGLTAIIVIVVVLLIAFILFYLLGHSNGYNTAVNDLEDYANQLNTHQRNDLKQWIKSFEQYLEKN